MSRTEFISLSIASVLHVFEEQNLGLFRPKKDKCDKCIAHQLANLSDDVFNLQQQQKMKTREEKLGARK